MYTHISQDITISIGNEISTRLSFAEGSSTKIFTFQGKDIDAKDLRISSQTTSMIVVYQMKLEEGEYATEWTPHPSDSIYSIDSDLVAALNGTTISGGLQLTTRIKLGLLSGGVWTEQGGISANTDNIMLWAGGTYSQAKAGNAKTILYHDGSGKWTGKLESNSDGDRIIIDPSDRSLKMVSSSVEVAKLFWREDGVVKMPFLTMAQYVNGQETYRAGLSPVGLGISYEGTEFISFMPGKIQFKPGRAIFNYEPQGSVYQGTLWYDSSGYVRIKL